MNETQSVIAWHFLAEGGLTRYVNPVKVEVGQTLTAVGPLALCKNGLHASRRALDALNFAPGPIICRVRVEGPIREDKDKLCGRRRTVLAMADATTALHEFACRCAEAALNGERARGSEPDPRSWAAIEAKRRWVRGEISGDDLAAAGTAAWEAAGAAAGAAGEAAWEAAGAAARAAGEAAWVAAGTAARAAWEAAWEAAGAAARGAGEAAWEAAGAAAGEAQNTELERLLGDLLGLGVAGNG